MDFYDEEGEDLLRLILCDKHKKTDEENYLFGATLVVLALRVLGLRTRTMLPRGAIL